MLRYYILLVSICTVASGANWLTMRGDAQRTGWQQNEKALNARTVKQLHLLWKLALGDASNRLTDPFILGPIITHRGIKELIFVKDSQGTVSAVDADLGRMYWSRNVANRRAAGRGDTPCRNGLRIMPVMAPAPIERNAKPESDDEFSDGNKPIYVLSGAGRLYALRPSTGADFSPPLQLLPPDVYAVDLDVGNNTLYVPTAAVCGSTPDRVSTLNLTVSTDQIGSDPRSGSIEAFRQLVFSGAAQTAFEWKGKGVFAKLLSDGKLVFTDAPATPVIFSRSQVHFAGGIATWQGEGERLIVVTRPGAVEVSRVTDNGDRLVGVPVWKSRGFPAAGSPVVANGIIYFLGADSSSKPSRLSLHALDGRTGAELYKSSDLFVSGISTGNLALANGHIAFSTADGVLYCFGIPFEM
jgi:outer membrane protein assembly factor BamB